MVSYVSNCPSTIKEFFLSPMIIDNSIYAHGSVSKLLLHCYVWKSVFVHCHSIFITIALKLVTIYWRANPLPLFFFRMSSFPPHFPFISQSVVEFFWLAFPWLYKDYYYYFIYFFGGRDIYLLRVPFHNDGITPLKQPWIPVSNPI